MYQDMSLWSTIDIVSTKDLLYFRTVEGDRYVTTNVCRCLSTT